MQVLLCFLGTADRHATRAGPTRAGPECWASSHLQGVPANSSSGKTFLHKENEARRLNDLGSPKLREPGWLFLLFGLPCTPARRGALIGETRTPADFLQPFYCLSAGFPKAFFLAFSPALLPASSEDDPLSLSRRCPRTFPVPPDSGRAVRLRERSPEAPDRLEEPSAGPFKNTRSLRQCLP